MPTVNVHDAKTHLSSLLGRVEKGETITIARAGTPIADLVPHPRVDIAFGVLAGRLTYDDEHFDDVNPEISAMFGLE